MGPIWTCLAAIGEVFGPGRGGGDWWCGVLASLGRPSVLWCALFGLDDRRLFAVGPSLRCRFRRYPSLGKGRVDDLGVHCCDLEGEHERVAHQCSDTDAVTYDLIVVAF